MGYGELCENPVTIDVFLALDYDAHVRCLDESGNWDEGVRFGYTHTSSWYFDDTGALVSVTLSSDEQVCFGPDTGTYSWLFNLYYGEVPECSQECLIAGYRYGTPSCP